MIFPLKRNFRDKIFVDCRSTVFELKIKFSWLAKKTSKLAKIFTLENFRLYGSSQTLVVKPLGFY